MPSPIETLVKILKLEREQGGSNRAVVGGLSAFGDVWAQQAYEQARRPEQRRLIDELASLLRGYDHIEDRSERLTVVSYMLDRILNRSQHAPSGEGAASAAPTPPDKPQRPPRRDNFPIGQQRSDTPTADRPERRPRRDARDDAPPPAREGRTAEDAPPRERRERPDRPARAERSENATAQPDRQDRDRERGSRKQRPEGDSADRPPRADRPAREQQPRQNNKPQRQPDNRPQQRQPQRPNRPQHHGDDDGPDLPEPAFDTSDPIEVHYTGKLDIPTEVRLAKPPRQPRTPMPAEQAADILYGLSRTIDTIRGIGQKYAELLAKLGITTIEKLLFCLPRRYDDYTRLLPIGRLRPRTTATVIGTVQRAELRVMRGGRKDLVVEFTDGTGALTATFFGQHYLTRTFHTGSQFVLHGSISVYQGRLQLANPEWEQIDPENLRTPGIVPVYRLTEGLTARTMRRLMREAVSYWAERLPDYMPASVLDRTELADLGWAIKNLHFPEGHDHLEHARQRHAFDQLILLQLAILRARREVQAVPALPLPVSDDFLESFIASVFPYPLTGAQQRAIADIRRDVAQSIPMNRLLQGDVGAGKTAVAVAALAMAYSQGKQSAMMAPTSILAEQHYRGLQKLLANLPEGQPRPTVALLTGALPAKDREAVIAGLAEGSIDIVVGTHAIIQDTVQFRELALAVIDEQHRFGVEQRAVLRGKGSNPHVLVMTATPIPRTLALTLYADLDLSVLDEMPPGRTPVRTITLQEVEREKMYRFITDQLNEGRQAFVIHPLVEASDTNDIASAVEGLEKLSSIFHRHRVGLLHGKMRPAEKDDIMAQFSAGDIDVLVTTSVAEVGVDVPNASVIVIEGANRFGLAQLHQFRGRVGRGQHRSYCFLLPDSAATPEAHTRLKALEQTNDGYKLAELDWRQRGAGDLVGTRQSGGNPLQLAESMTPSLVELAQREARTLFEEDPDLRLPEHQLLAKRVQMLYNPDSDVS
jgi:ATP-dependent DNA helicase RecG